VKDYRPEELSIKTEGDVLVVMGKHETKSEGGSSFISKQFEQKFSLPSGVKPGTLYKPIFNENFKYFYASWQVITLVHKM
jgi:hypothetical protein